MLPFDANFYQSKFAGKKKPSNGFLNHQRFSKKTKGGFFNLENKINISPQARERVEQFPSAHQLLGKPAELHQRLGQIYQTLSSGSPESFNDAEWQDIGLQLDEIRSQIEALSDYETNPAFSTTVESLGVTRTHVERALAASTGGIQVEAVDLDRLYDELSAVKRNLGQLSGTLSGEEGTPAGTQAALEGLQIDLTALVNELDPVLDDLGPLQSWQVRKAREAVTDALDAIEADLASNGNLSLHWQDRVVQLETVREELIDRLGFVNDETREHLTGVADRLHDIIGRSDAGGSKELRHLSHAVNHAIEKMSKTLLNSDTENFERLILGPGLGQLAQVKEAILRDQFDGGQEKLDSHKEAIRELRGFIQGLADWTTLSSKTRHSLETQVIAVLDRGLDQTEGAEEVTSALGGIQSAIDQTLAKLEGLEPGVNQDLAVEVYKDLQSIHSRIEQIDAPSEHLSSIGEEVEELIEDLQGSYQSITQPRVLVNDDAEEPVERVKAHLRAAMDYLEASVRYGDTSHANLDAAVGGFEDHSEEISEWGQEFLRNYNAADAVVSHLISDENPDRLTQVVNNDRLFEGIRKLKFIASEYAEKQRESLESRQETLQEAFNLDTPQDSPYIAFNKEALDDLDVREVTDIGMQNLGVKASEDQRHRRAEFESEHSFKPIQPQESDE